MKRGILDKLKERFPKGSFTTKEAISNEISPRMLSFYVEKGKLERVGRGLYIFPDFEIDIEFQFSDLALKAKCYKEAVICLISALDYWNLTEEIPRECWLALPNNYPIPKGHKNIRFIRPRDLETGVIEKSIAGQKVKITGPERSISDAFKYLDDESAISSLRLYLSQEGQEIRIRELLEIAIKLKSIRLIKVLKDTATAQARDYPFLNPESLKETIKWLSKKEG